MIAHRRKTLMKLLRLLICGVGLSLGMGGGGGCACEVEFFTVFKGIGSVFLWPMLVLVGFSSPFPLTAPPESSGPSQGGGGVTTPLAQGLVLEELIGGPHV